ncbi:MAG: TetR/AcrR family transcriptional regulator [Solirubrobacterales bacterium]
MSSTNTSAPARETPGPGRPPSDASERIVEATIEILSSDGYAGLTTARVAALSGQNKAMISYYFGSKSGLVSEVARQVAGVVVDEILGRIEHPENAKELVQGLVGGIGGLIERDSRLAQVYIDLASRSGTDSEPRRILDEMKSRYREILGGLLANLADPPAADRIGPISTYLIASMEGFLLEQLDRGETDDLVKAREILVTSAEAAVRNG